MAIHTPRYQQNDHMHFHKICRGFLLIPTLHPGTYRLLRLLTWLATMSEVDGAATILPALCPFFDGGREKYVNGIQTG